MGEVCIPRERRVTGIALSCRLDMVARFTGGGTAVVTARTGSGHIRMVEAYIGPARSRDMAGITLSRSRNMVGVLTRRLSTVMAGGAAACHQVVVKLNRCPV